MKIWDFDQHFLLVSHMLNFYLVNNVFGNWNKDEISPTPSFSCSLLNIRMSIFGICFILSLFVVSTLCFDCL